MKTMGQKVRINFVLSDNFHLYLLSLYFILDRVYDSRANMRIQTKQGPSDFFIQKKWGQFPNQSIILST